MIEEAGYPFQGPVMDYWFNSRNAKHGADTCSYRTRLNLQLWSVWVWKNMSVAQHMVIQSVVDKNLDAVGGFYFAEDCLSWARNRYILSSRCESHINLGFSWHSSLSTVTVALADFVSLTNLLHLLNITYLQETTGKPVFNYHMGWQEFGRYLDFWLHKSSSQTQDQRFKFKIKKTCTRWARASICELCILYTNNYF